LLCLALLLAVVDPRIARITGGCFQRLSVSSHATPAVTISGRTSDVNALVARRWQASCVAPCGAEFRGNCRQWFGYDGGGLLRAHTDRLTAATSRIVTARLIAVTDAAAAAAAAAGDAVTHR